MGRKPRFIETITPLIRNVRKLVDEKLEQILLAEFQNLSVDSGTLSKEPKYVDEINFTAVGMRYRGNYRFTSFDSITLEMEPTNKYDTNAIKVLANGEHKAYVSKSECVTVIPYLNDKLPYAVKLLEHFDASARMCLCLSSLPKGM